MLYIQLYSNLKYSVLLMYLLRNKRQRKPKGQSRMDNAEKTEGAIKNGQCRETGNIDEEKQNKNTTQHNMCWTPLYANKHK